MAEIQLRPYEITDAKRLYEILSNPNFIFFPASPKSVEDEENWIRDSFLRTEQGICHNFAVLYNGDLIG